MQPYFQVAVKIATVVAVRPKGGSVAGGVCGDVGRPSLSTGLPASRSCCTPRESPACGQPVGADGVRRFAVGGSAVQIRGGSVIFDSLTVCLGRLCRVGACAV